MRPDIETAVRQNLVEVLAADLAPENVSSDVDLTGAYGLTSLNKVLFLTAVCQETGIDLAHFTEDDLARMHTLRDWVEVLSRHRPPAA
jgi:acyl carrier protein